MKQFILFINGSPRKNGRTVNYLKEVMKGAKKEGAKVKLIHLIDFKILPCLGCYSVSPEKCTFPCVQKDDMQEIYKLILKADGMVLGSPAYWFSVTGLMKNFIDRLTSLEQKDLLDGKIVGCVACAQESGGDEVSNYLISTFNEMGCIIPPFASPFFDESGKGTWQKKDLEILGRNIVRMARVIKKAKLL
jgi:multimeric flavodoxin WrbA